MADEKHLRILVVDDNAVVRRALKGVIHQDKRFVVVGEAWNGETALEAIKTLNPHLVCLDVVMPGVDGLTVLRTIKQEHPAIRVVMITGQATPDVVNEALALGAKGFVVKPFNATKVLATIYGALR